VAEDRDIIASSLARSEAFEAIFDRYWHVVLRYARQRVGFDVGEEIASRTFLVAFERRARFDSQRASAKPWLLGIATNLIGRHVRDEHAHFAALMRVPIEGLEHPFDDPVKFDALAQRPALVAGLIRLSAEDRNAFLLLALGDLSYPQIAEALGIPEGTVASRIHRAKGQLREGLESEVGIQDVRPDA
jgi:RNA polymerase sigma factor (sigma-70 family)